MIESSIPKLSSERLNAILQKMEGKKVLVLGDVGLDRYTIGSVERISPEAPVPIVLVEEEKHKLGLASNVADNIQALGGVAILIGIVGRDRAAEEFRSMLKSRGISDAYLVEDPSRRTVLKERVVSERQQLVRIDYESTHPIDSQTENRILEEYRKALAIADIVVIEDYAKGLATSSLTQAVIQMAKDAGKKIAVDPNLKTSLSLYSGATILTPNTKEAEHLSGIRIKDLPALKEAGRVLLEKASCEHVMLTRGKEGMAIFTRGSGEVKLIPTYAREVYDVSGAGDTVIAALVLSLMAGATIEEASIVGNLAAGIEVGKRGTATVSPQEIREFSELQE